MISLSLKEQLALNVRREIYYAQNVTNFRIINGVNPCFVQNFASNVLPA